MSSLPPLGRTLPTTAWIPRPRSWPGVVDLDRWGFVRGWDGQTERLFGWSEEALGKPLPLGTRQQQALFGAVLDRVAAGETVIGGETSVCRGDGGLVEVSVCAAPLLDAAGEVGGVMVTLCDITKAEDGLAPSPPAAASGQEAELRYQMLFDGNPFPMWVYDLATLAFLAVNDAAIEHYGYSREEFLSMTIKDIRPAEDVPALLEDVERISERKADTRSWSSRPWKHRKKDGTLFDVEVRATTLSFDGRKTRLVLARDVSVERRLASQLRQAQKMDAMGRLAGGVAHDFNNVLFVIAGYAEQIRRRLPAEDPSREKALSILKATDRAAALTRQLLTFSRNEVQEPRVFSLNTVVREMESMLVRLLGEQIELSTALLPEPWPVKADPSQIEQVLMNLAVNARDAMPAGGRVVLETRNVELDAAYARVHVGLPPGQYVMLSVSDTGVGMDAATQGRIFEPFFTTKAPDKGTGLGLSIVYGIVKQSGGSIEVYSHLGRGTTFKVYLPRVHGPADRAAIEEEACSHKGGSETILLAEDEADVRNLARETLEEHGYTVLEATDGKEALALAAERPPDLLLTDMVLPTTTGGDLAGAVARTNPEVGVLYMSGYTDRALLSQGEIEDGASFLHKPFTLDALVRKVREVLDRLSEPPRPPRG